MGMDIYTFLGYVGAFIIGIILGLVGGGGSILTVPVLVYIMGTNPIVATAYSLFVVGMASLVGAITNFKKGLVDVRTSIVFAVPAFIGVYATRAFLIPAIPEELFTFGGFTLSKNSGVLIFFALLMLVAAVTMIFDTKSSINQTTKATYNYPLILIEGLIIGVITGIVGAGGGFLIIPALVLLAKLPMKKAVGTSLLIVAVKSLIGFLGDVQHLEIEWAFLLLFTGVSIMGIVLGMYLSNFIEGNKLKKGFGWFVLLMGLFILGFELM